MNIRDRDGQDEILSIPCEANTLMISAKHHNEATEGQSIILM